MCVSANLTPLFHETFRFENNNQRRPASVPPNWSPPDSPRLVRGRDVTEKKKRIEHFIANPDAKALSFSDLKISTLPRGLFLTSEIGRRLTSLDLSFNNFRRVGESLSKFVALENLHLDNNEELTELPSCIADLKRLKVLSVSKTALQTLPESLPLALEELNLSFCARFWLLPSSINKLSSLRVLNLLMCINLYVPGKLYYDLPFGCRVDTRHTWLQSNEGGGSISQAGPIVLFVPPPEIAN